MEQREKVFTVKKVEIILDAKEDTLALVECIKSMEMKATSIGEGGNAIIYAVLGTAFDKVCLKKVKEKPQIMLNDIIREHEFQDMVEDAGVRTPHTLASIDTSEGKYLIMERVEGHSVFEVLQNPKLLPENFDAKVFCDSLDEQIAKMHRAGIYHRDLHYRNVMVNMDGLPVIIDFGTATEGSGSDFTYEESVSMYDPQKGRYGFVNGYFKDDLEMVKNIKAGVKNLKVEK